MRVRPAGYGLRPYPPYEFLLFRLHEANPTYRHGRVFRGVEQKRNPDLAGKPVVVGGRGDPRGQDAVSTASYEARNYGIHSAMPLRAAFRLCPQAVFLAVDYELCARISAIIKTILRDFTPLVEDAGLDEAYLDITGLEPAPEQFATKIKQRIRERTGLSCSIGIAPNKLLAKICSDLDKPDGLTVLTEAELKNRIWPLPVSSIPGIGPVTAERLVPMGVTTIRQLASMPLADLVKEFGPSHGEFLYLASRGIDRRPVVTHREPKSHSRERTFQHESGPEGAAHRYSCRRAREIALPVTLPEGIGPALGPASRSPSSSPDPAVGPSPSCELASKLTSKAPPDRPDLV